MLFKAGRIKPAPTASGTSAIKNHAKPPIPRWLSSGSVMGISPMTDSAAVGSMALKLTSALRSTYSGWG
jgi:hypothetical protein